MTCGSTTVTATSTLSGGETVDYQISHDISCAANNEAGAWAEYTITDAAGGVLPTYYYHESATGGTFGTASATADGATHRVDAADNWRICPTLTESATAQLLGNCGPSIQFELDARLRAFGQPFPATEQVTYLAANVYQNGDFNDLFPTLNVSGEATASWQQDRYQEAAVLFGVARSVLFRDDRAPFYAWLSSLGSADDSRDWRLPVLGFKWPAFNLGRTAVTLDACSATTHWTAGPNTTLSIVGGHLLASASGGSGSLTLAVPAAVRVWEAFRYLQASGLASQSMSITVGAGGQSWTLPFTTSAQALQADLCCGGTESNTVKGRDSRFPLTTPASGPHGNDPTVQYLMGWGVDCCDSITISGIPTGQSLTLTGITLELAATDGLKAITFLPPFLGMVQGWTDGGGTTYQCNPFAYVETDWRISDWPAVTLAAGALAFRSISDLKADLAYLPGVSVGAITQPTDGYHGIGLPALLLGGSGATYDWHDSAWMDWVDVDISGSVAIAAQDLWDEVFVYPAAGNVWTQADSFGGPTPLKIGKSLRGQGTGIAFTTQNKPYNSAAVKAFVTSTSAAAGGAISGPSLGEYATGTPWGKGNVDVTTQLQAGPTPWLSGHETWRNRLRSRWGFRQGSMPGEVANLHSPFGQYIAAVAGSSGVVVKGAEFGAPDGGTWITASNPITAPMSYVHMTEDNPDASVLLMASDGTTCYRKRTWDHAATWASETPMTGVKFERGATSASNVCTVLGLVAASMTIKGQIMMPGDTSFGSTFIAANASGANLVLAQEPFDVSYGRDLDDALVLKCWISGDADFSEWRSFDYGRTFARVT